MGWHLVYYDVTRGHVGPTSRGTDTDESGPQKGEYA